MKPKNLIDRRNNFLKFLLLFIVTVSFIIFSIFLTYKVPIRENEILKAQIKKVEKEMDFQNKFSDDMVKVKGMLDSLDVPGQNVSYQNSLISAKLVDMQKSIPTKDSTFKYDMYTNIVNIFIDIQKMKEKLRDLKDSESTIEEYKEALEETKQGYKELERELLIYRQHR